MTRSMRLASLGVCALLLMPVAAWAQFPSETVGFNGPPIDEEGAHEMFQIPQYSGSTAAYIVPNPAGTYDANNAYRASGMQTEGAAALQVFFNWLGPADPDAWVRLTTFAGPQWPNPSVHTGGKVHFKITNRSELFLGQVGICLGIRETGANVPQLRDGGAAGTIEWVGVDNSTMTMIRAGEDGVIDSTLMDDDVIVDVEEDPEIEVLAISWGPNRQLDSIYNPLDEAYYGCYATDDGSGAGSVHPIPVLMLPVNAPPNPTYWELEFDLATGQADIVNDANPAAGGIAPSINHGNGVWDVTRGTLEHIAFVNVSTDTAVLIDTAIDELWVEAPEPDPVLPPTVVWPIINGDLEVYVTDVQTGMDLVRLYDNDIQVGEESVTPGEDVTFTLAPPGAITDHVFTAAQHEPVNDIWSEPSAGVTVLPFPPVLSFSLLIDEGGNGSCSPIYDWEFVPVTSADNWSPLGMPLFADDAVWQVIDVPLDDDELVLNGYLGDGILGPSPTGFYTIDSAWFTFPQDGLVGPWEILVDSMQVIDEFGQPGEVLLDFETGTHFSFARGQSPDQDFDVSARTEAGSYDGVASHRFVWSYNGTAPESIGFLQRIGSSCGTSALIPDTASGLRFRMCVRNIPSAPDVPLPEVAGPIVGAQDTVRVLCDATATTVYLYVNGDEVTSLPPTPGDGYVDFPGLALMVGDSVSAKQVLPAPPTSDFAYPRAVTDLVPAPTVASPIFPGATQVTVNDLMTTLYAEAELVTVIVRDTEGVLVATYSEVPAGGSEVVDVDALPNEYQVSATQTINGVESPESEVVIVEFVTPVIHHCPAEGDTEMRVLRVYPGAIVTATLRDAGDVVVDTFTAGPPAEGETEVTVTGMSGLLTGYTLTVYQTFGSISSAESAPDTVTVNTSTMVFEDTMESYATQEDYENEFDEFGDPILSDTGWWPSSGDPVQFLDFTKNTTVGGGKCSYCPGEASEGGTLYDGWSSNHDFNWRINPIPPVQPTDTEPVIWSFTLYDTEGPGADRGNQWASLMDWTGGLDGLISVGLSGSDWTWDHEPLNNDYYNARVYDADGTGWGHFNLHEIEAPLRTRGWHMFTTVIKYDTIDFYVDGKLCRKNAPRSTVPEYENLYMGSGYRPTYDAYYDDFRVQTGAVVFHEMAPQAPPEPTLVSPLEEGDTVVTVTDIAADANLVTVYDATTTLSIGAIIPEEGQDTVDVPVAALVHLHSIVATQSNDVAQSDDSGALEVGKGSGDVLVCIGIRETGDTGDLGTPGSNSGPIEWVGAASALDGAPQGVPISATGGWVTMEFDPVNDPKTGFTGDGQITETRGTLEHLAVAVNSTSPDRSTGVYYLYVDNVVNVGAGDGGADFVIEDFEAYDLDTEVLFQEPTYSGSTDQHMSYPPSYSGTTDAYGNPGQSEFLTWFWLDTTAQRWARITSYGLVNRPNPIIDLTRPIRLDVLLVEHPATAVCCHGYYCEDWSPSDQAGCEADYGTFIPYVTCSGLPCTCFGQVERGDSNCLADGVNAYDIDHFIQAVGQAPQWVADHPGCDLFCANDINCDGGVNAYDIDGFIDCVSQGTCDPCP